MKRGEVLERVRRAVPDAYTAGEARAIAFEVAECFCGFSRAEAVADPGAEAVADRRGAGGVVPADCSACPVAVCDRTDGILRSAVPCRGGGADTSPGD